MTCDDGWDDVYELTNLFLCARIGATDLVADGLKTIRSNYPELLEHGPDWLKFLGTADCNAATMQLWYETYGRAIEHNLIDAIGLEQEE